MLDPIASAQGKIYGPLMLEWALRYYDNLPENKSKDKARIETKWFHDLFIAQLIEQNETEALSRLFRSLPAQHFSSLTTLIVNRWLDWPARLANAATRVLAVNAPMELMSLFDAYQRRIEQGASIDIERLLDIHLLDKAEVEIEASYQSFLNWLSQKLLALPENNFRRTIYLSTLLRLGNALPFSTLASVLDAALQSDESTYHQENVLKALFYGLFGHMEYLDLVISRDKKESEQCLEMLAPLFLQETPLAQLDQWLESPPIFSKVVPLLEKLSNKSKKCARILMLLQGSTEISRSLPDNIKSQLGVAACIHGFGRETFDDLTLNLEATVELLSVDLSKPQGYRALFQHLQIFSQQDVATALISRLPSVCHTYGGVQLAKVMGDLAWPEFVPCLIDSLKDDKGDFLCEASQNALIKIGNPSQVALIECWNDLDVSQRIYGLSVIKDIGGKIAADFADTHFESLMDDNVEFCCELMLAAPDPRLLDRLRPEVRREQPLIDRAYYIISHLLDQGDVEAQAAKSRVLEDLRKRSNIRKAFDSGDFSRSSLSLELRCPLCAAVNQYEVKGVIVAKDQDQDQEQDATHLIHDEFPCASCDQEVEFEFTSSALMALSAEILLIAAARESGQQKDSLITYLSCQLDGQSVPVAIGLKKLRDRVSNTPSDALAWFQLGKLLAYINRPKAAIHALSQAGEIAPDAIDVKLALAQIVASNNSNEEAFIILSDAMNRLSGWKFLVAHPNFSQEFTKFYNNLRRTLGRNDLPVLHPAMLTKPKKVGRNDPCPCGSGKKFKKCCDKQGLEYLDRDTINNSGNNVS